ncbi:hypothetical protein KAI54_00275 [Candidatus Gracilibacteria bacterium]|nr:hypothetical protein [Candidatus Gracilibacteria bacterium]
MKKSLAESAWQTVCWFDIFGQPVNAEEIHRFLFGAKASQKDVKKVLAKDSRIGKSFGFYFPRGRSALILKSCAHHHRAEKLWMEALRHRFIFRLTPFLKLAAVGNTLAMGWPEKNSDIDLLVVAEKNRLFTTRFFLTLFTQIFGMRRSGRKIAGRFCLSFFLAENSLNLEKIKIGRDDPYLAFWIATLVPIYGKGEEFFAANGWVKKYFPNLKLPAIQKKIRQKTFLERVLNRKLGDFLERVLRNWQLTRAQRKQKNRGKNAVIISEKILKFHETDQRKEFLEQWKKRVNSKSVMRK